MSLNLLDQAKGYFNNEVINQLSSSLNESESGIAKAVKVVLPTIIGWLADKSGSAEGLSSLTKLAELQEGKGILSSISNFLHQDEPRHLADEGKSTINALFGESKNESLAKIADYAGIKSSSVSSIVGLALPTVLGLLGKHFKTDGFDFSTITNFFSSEKSKALSFLPTDFSETHQPKIDVANAVRPRETQRTVHVAEKERSKGIWLLPLLGLLLALGAAWWFTREKEADVAVNTTAKETNVDTTFSIGKLGADGDFIYNEGDSITLTLPNNIGELHVGKYSTEAKLVNFLNDKEALIDTAKGNWFEFTNLHFKTGSAELTDASSTQLTNMVAIAKAYPAAKFKFGGYTDNTGDEAANIALSQKRADAVTAMVTKLGASATSFVEAKGYGPAFPVADNSTPEGRAQNRRVAVNVKVK